MNVVTNRVDVGDRYQTTNANGGSGNLQVRMRQNRVINGKMNPTVNVTVTGKIGRGKRGVKSRKRATVEPVTQESGRCR